MHKWRTDGDIVSFNLLQVTTFLECFDIHYKTFCPHSYRLRAVPVVFFVIAFAGRFFGPEENQFVSMSENSGISWDWLNMFIEFISCSMRKK